MHKTQKEYNVEQNLLDTMNPDFELIEYDINVFHHYNSIQFSISYCCTVSMFSGFVTSELSPPPPHPIPS